MLIRFSGIVFLLFQSLFVFAQQDLTQQRAAMEKLFTAENYTAALKKALEIKSYTEKKYGALDTTHAHSLMDVATAYYYLYDCANSLSNIGAAKEIYLSETGSKSYSYAYVLQQQSYMLLNCNQVEKAEEATFQSLTIIQENVKDSILLLASLYSDLGYLQTTLGKIVQAKGSYATSQRLMKSGGFTNTYQYAFLLNNIASFYHDLDDYTNAKAYYEESIDIHKAIYGVRSPEYATVLNNLGVLYLDFGDYEHGAELIFKVADLHKSTKGEQSLEYAMSLNDIGNVYDKEGDYQNAELYYTQSLNLKKTIVGEGHVSYWTTMNNLSIMYAGLGNYTKASALMQSLLALVKKYKGDKQPEYGNYLNTMGYICVEEGLYTNAETYFNQALTFYKSYYGENNASYSRVLNNLALVYSKQKNKAKALQYYQQSLAILQADTSDQVELAETYNNIGELYSETGDYKNAAIQFQKALSVYDKVLGQKHPSYWITYSNVALLDYRSGNITKSIEETKTMLDKSISMLYNNFAFLSESEKIKYWNKAYDNFDFFNSMCVKKYPEYPDLINNMYDYTLATKSIVFNYTSQLKSKIFSSGNQSLIDQYNDWEKKKQVLATYYNFTRKQLAEKNINLAALENEVAVLEKNIALQSVDFNVARDIRKVTWKDVQSKLKENEAAVQIVKVQLYNNTWTDSIVYAALIITKETTGHPVMVVLKNGNELEKKYYKGFSNAVKFNQVTVDYYNAFWKDIDQHLTNKTVVYVSPSGVYNKISLEALKLPDGAYMLQKRSIQLVPTLRNLVTNTGLKNPVIDHAHLFGHPDFNYVLHSDSTGLKVNTNGVDKEQLRSYQLNELPATKVEVDKIAGILKSNRMTVTIYTGNNATESKIKSLKNPPVLHIATHGYFIKDYELTDEDSTSIGDKYGENPLLRSGILLAGSNYTLSNQSFGNPNDDGILTAYEAMQLDLDKTDLVILSACETGLGEEMNGEGVLGLQRAFMLAGADNMLMSLWQVSDEGTQLLMTYFYKYWVIEKNVGIALNKAQLELMKTHPSPYYWAAFVYIKQ